MNSRRELLEGHRSSVSLSICVTTACTIEIASANQEIENTFSIHLAAEEELKCQGNYR
jgi:hypothetical protein